MAGSQLFPFLLTGKPKEIESVCRQQGLNPGHLAPQSASLTNSPTCVREILHQQFYSVVLSVNFSGDAMVVLSKLCDEVLLVGRRFGGGDDDETNDSGEDLERVHRQVRNVDSVVTLKQLTNRRRFRDALIAVATNRNYGKEPIHRK